MVFRSRGKPPDDRRCKGIYSERTKDESRIGQRCESWNVKGKDFCVPHTPIPDELRCIGHLAKDHPRHPGERCPCQALPGRTVCGFHGGKSPNAIAAAARRIAEGKALKLVQTYGLKIETTATDALLDEVQWTAGHVAWLRERVQEIEEYSSNSDSENPLVWGVTRRKEGGEDRGVTEEAGPNIWIKLYQAERNHLLKVCDAAIRAGIEERRVKLAEQQGALVAKAIHAILGDLDLTAEQAARIPEIVPRHLRALAS